MKTIIYTSEFIPVTDSTQTIVNGIIKQALKNNIPSGITGVLFFHNNTFMQVIEGEQDNLYALFANLQKDTRHKNINVIFQGEIEKRHFPNWQMQLFDLDRESNFSADIIFRIKQIYEQNLKFNSSDFIALLQASLNDEDFLKQISK